ncbi:MAG: NTP transferase domain-containing protein, partial [Anaerolineales bacterium]|nr:NTP transferase domain-containing protein [Anaerolineales bacterium]
YIDSSLIQALIRAHRRTLSPIVAPRVGDRWANPVLFDRATFPALQTISGDRGGRALFDRFRISGIEWDASILLDVDTPDDLRTLGLSH